MPGPPQAETRKWVTLLLASLLALFGAISLVRNTGLTVPDDGASWSDFAGNVVLVELGPGGPAARAGLQVGDVLRSIDGRGVLSAISAENRLWDFSGESGAASASYGIERDGRSFELVLTPARSAGSGSPLAPFLAVVGFFFLTTGAYVTIRLPRSRLTVPYALLSFSLFAVLALSDTPRAETVDWWLFWLDRAGRILAPAAFLHFVSAFLRRDGAGRSRLTVGAIYLPSILLGASGLLLIAAGRAASADSPSAALNLQGRLELGWLAASFLLGTALLTGAYLSRSSRGVHRQLRWMLWGAIGGLVPFALTYLAPSALGMRVPAWAPITTLPMILLPLALASALLHYRLSDLELFMKRGVATISVVFFTLATYDLVWTLTGHLLPGTLDPQGFTTAGLAALATALLFSQIKALTLSLVDRIFYRGRYNFRRTLLSFGRELNSELDLDTLLSKIERRVAETMALDRLAVYLAYGAEGAEGAAVLKRAGRGLTGPEQIVVDEEILDRLRGVSYLGLEDLAAGSDAGRALGEAGLNTLFPMRVKGEVRALLAAGARATGDPLNSDDLEMIVALCGQAASAIEAARLLRQLSEKVSEVEQLRRAHENILESSQVAILVVDDDGIVRNVNRASEELTGVPRGEARGRALREVYSLPFVRGIEQLMERARAEAPSGLLRTYRSGITNRAGNRLRVNVTLARLEDAVGTRGAPVAPCASDDAGVSRIGDAGWVVTLDDVTEQVRMEETLLRQDRLAAVGLLASGVAHEVNTPLTGISSYAQMLLEETSPEDPRHDLLRKIEKQAARASAIANGLLNFSRGNGEESRETLDAAEMVEEAMTLVEPQLRGPDVLLVRDIAPDLPPLAGHRGKLQQVVLNLLLNARDALDGKGTIRVSLKRVRDHLRLTVNDDGCGILEEDLGRIFDPFFTTKSPGEGTGLGLALSWNIVKEHRGEITVESRRGEGTTFQVDLPLEQRASASG